MYLLCSANCLDLLAKLGEEFPSQPDLAIVKNKLSEVQPLLLALTADRMKALPTMMDTIKLQAMKFLGMLCEISLKAAPLLLPLLSVRMMKLTFQFGFCNDSILGIFYTAFSVVSSILVKGHSFICSLPLQYSCIDVIEHGISFSLQMMYSLHIKLVKFEWC